MEGIVVVLLLALGVLWAYTAKMQEVTLRVGRKLAEDNLFAGRNGFQDAITARAQTVRNYSFFLMLVLTVVLAFMIDWYWALVAIVAVFMVAGIAKLFMPHTELYYLRAIVVDLARREADYIKRGDTARAEAARDMNNDVALYVARLLHHKSRNNFAD